MAKENIFNLFLIAEDKTDLMRQYGVAVHEIDGTDEEKYQFLKNNVGNDYKHITLFPVPKNFKTVILDTDKKLKGIISIRSAQQLIDEKNVSLFEDAFLKFNAPINPLFVATVLKHGVPIGAKSIKKMNSTNTETALFARGFSSSQIEKIIESKLTLGKIKMLTDDKLSELGLSKQQIKDLRDEGRPLIPFETTSKLLFESKRTCCICRDSKKPIIIHHIIDWHISNSHDEENLVVLCLEHHDLAHTKKFLSLALKPDDIKDVKAKWIEEVKKQDTRTILGLSNFDYSRWDYINQNRFFELFLSMSKEFSVNKKVYDDLLSKNIISSLGLINDTGSWTIKDRPSESHFFNFSEGYILAYYMKELINGVLSEIPIRDLTNNYSREIFKSSIEIGDYISLTKGFYFKSINKINKGRNQLRKAYYQKDNIKIEFVFDAYECTSTSAWSDHLTGHNIITPILRVLGLIEDNDNLVINTSCIAIGSYFGR